MQEFLVRNPASMQRLGARLQAACPLGFAVALQGPLGIGKSVFVKGFAKAFGIEEHIVSPTFTLLQEYGTEGRMLYHFDLYRLSDRDEFQLIGGDDIIGRDDGVFMIEWPELIEGSLRKDRTVFVRISKESDEVRKVAVDSPFGF